MPSPAQGRTNNPSFSKEGPASRYIPAGQGILGLEPYFVRSHPQSNFMSGHSKWATTKHHKAIVDAKKGKTLTKHAKIITVAARLGGGDPAMNASLAGAIERAKKDGVPNANIDRAIKIGTGELKEGAEIVESLYEGYGPSGVALLIKTLSDNKNRTVAELRHLLSQSGGNLGESGSVAWMFVRKGLIETKADLSEDLQLELIDQGADDVGQTEEGWEITTDPAKLGAVTAYLKSKGIAFEAASLTYLATNKVEVANEEDAEKVLGCISKLEEHDDIDEVFHNMA